MMLLHELADSLYLRFKTLVANALRGVKGQQWIRGAR